MSLRKSRLPYLLISLVVATPMILLLASCTAQVDDEGTPTPQFTLEGADAYFERAMAKFNQRLYGEAIRDLNQVIRRDRSHVQAYFFRGLSKSARGVFREAIVDYTRVVALEPNHGKVYFVLVNSL